MAAMSSLLGVTTMMATMAGDVDGHMADVTNLGRSRRAA